MILTRREKTYSIVVGAAVGALGLYFLVLSPYIIKPITDNKAEIARLTAARTLHNQTITAAEKLRALRAQQTRDGLTSQIHDADTELDRSMNEWTNLTRVAFGALKPERGASLLGDTFLERTVQFTGTSNAYSAEYLIYKIETAPYLHLNSLQISTRRDGVDDLTVQISVSTICPNVGQPAATAPATQPQGE